MTRRVTYARHWALYAVIDKETGLWLAGLLTEAARAAYVARNGYEVVG